MSTFNTETAVQSAERLGVEPASELPKGAENILSPIAIDHLIELVSDETNSLSGLEVIATLEAIELLRADTLDVFQEANYANYLRELFGSPLSDEATPVAVALLSKLTLAQQESATKPRLLHELVTELKVKIDRYVAQLKANQDRLLLEKAARLRTIQTLKSQEVFNPLVQAGTRDSANLNQRSIGQIETEFAEIEQEVSFWRNVQKQAAGLFVEVWTISSRVLSYDDQLDLSHTQDWGAMQKK